MCVNERRQHGLVRRTPSTLRLETWALVLHLPLADWVTWASLSGGESSALEVLRAPLVLTLHALLLISPLGAREPRAFHS